MEIIVLKVVVAVVVIVVVIVVGEVGLGVVAHLGGEVGITADLWWVKIPRIQFSQPGGDDFFILTLPQGALGKPFGNLSSNAHDRTLGPS